MKCPCYQAAYREAEICSPLIGRQRSAPEETLLPEERTRAYWLGHLTKARQLAGFCQLVRSCLERPLSPAWRLGTSTASPTPVPIGCFGARHHLTRSGTRSTRVLAHCGGISFCERAPGETAAAAQAECKGPRARHLRGGQPLPLRTCLDHCPGLSSGSLYLQPASRPESSKFEAPTWRGNI